MKSCDAVFVSLSVATLLSGCGGGKNVKNDDPYSADRVAAIARDLKYHKVIVHPYTVDKSVEEPGTAAVECNKATLEFLAEKHIFQSVKTAGDAAGDPDTLVVDADVQSLRIVGGAARFWGGAFAGSSHMTLQVVARDSTGAAVGQRAVSNDNNAMGAAWSFGASDRGLPEDLGTLVADAIVKLARRPQATTGSK
jgi:hypothetical protein